MDLTGVLFENFLELSIKTLIFIKWFSIVNSDERSVIEGRESQRP